MPNARLGSVSTYVCIVCFEMVEITTCQPNPCRHGGKCLALERKSFTCNCEGTGYKGSHCQTGFVTTPIFAKLRPNISSGTLHVMARPSKSIQLSFSSAKGLTFEPPSVEIRFPKRKEEFRAKAEKPGIHAVGYGLRGESKDDFLTPQRSVILVAKGTLDHKGLNTTLLLPKGELPIGCEKQLAKTELSCEIRLLSTTSWTGRPGSTSGIVHFITANNQTVPLSLIGLNLKHINFSRDEFIEAAIAKTSSQNLFTVLHKRNGTCQSRVGNSDNLLELMQSDAFVSSFMKAFSEMAPEWLKLAVAENNDVFDIQNIAVNLAPDMEHCSGFPISQTSSHSYYHPVVNYKMHVAQHEATLFADGRTCFVINFCKPAVFMNFPEEQANHLKRTLSMFRDMEDIGLHLRVDSIGLLYNTETTHFVKGIIWDGIKLQELLPFDYNMWLKGSLDWNMEIPKLLSVTLKLTGETFVKSRNIDAVSSLTFKKTITLRVFFPNIFCED